MGNSPASEVRGQENSPVKRFRFVDGDDLSNNKNGHADLYNAGLRWNNHYYCVPASEGGGSELAGAYSCN